MTGVRHEELRRATDAAHRALEATMDGTRCFTSADGFRDYLAAVAPLYASLEAALDAADAARFVPDWPRRRKLPLILAELGADNRPPEQPFQVEDGASWSGGDVFGAMYVLEGATLGGAVLARRLRDLGLATQPHGAPSFPDPYGAERGLLWRGFLSRLDAADLTAPEEHALQARATATFALFADAVAGLA